MEAPGREEGLKNAGHNLSSQDPTQELGTVTNAGPPPSMTFTLFPIDEQLPPGYRLVTVREVQDHREAVNKTMPRWEIANLADGSVDGKSYGGHTRLDKRNDVAHKLATEDQELTANSALPMEERLDYGGHDQDPTQNVASAMIRETWLDDTGHNLAKQHISTQDPSQAPDSISADPGMTFTLFPIDEQLPPGYRLVTVREVHNHREALRRAMPGWEIANLADGSVDGKSYGGHTRLDRRNDVAHKLATEDQELTANSALPMEERLDYGGHNQDPTQNAALAMTRETWLDDTGHNLATQDISTQDPSQAPDGIGADPGMTFTLFPIDEQLPPGYRLVTVREVHNHREALRRAMPGWEIANLADGSVDGMHYRGHTRLTRRNDTGHELATQDHSATYAKMNMQDLRVTYPWGQPILPAFLIVLVGILIYMIVKL